MGEETKVSNLGIEFRNQINFVDFQEFLRLFAL